MYENIIEFIKKLYPNKNPIPLHEPVFSKNAKIYLERCIDSTYVSYVGEYVNKFEEITKEFIVSENAIAVVNGTAALHIALIVSGVKNENEVITQPLTFVATANAIRHSNAYPIFIDVDKDTLGLSPEKLEYFLKKNTEIRSEKCINKTTGRIIKACVPMHTFGHPCRIDEIVDVCNRFHLDVIEDAAESLGSFYKKKHTGTFGKIGILSFNGNKIVTTGGGGMILTHDAELARQVKHLTTQAKVTHPWKYFHDKVAYNYRLTNLQAAVGLSQMEQLPDFLENKRIVAEKYKSFFDQLNIKLFVEPKDSKSNYWLNAIIMNDKKERDRFLKYSNLKGIMTRPAWELMNLLPMFKECQTENIDNAKWLVDRIVNIPSSVINQESH